MITVQRPQFIDPNFELVTEKKSSAREYDFWSNGHDRPVTGLEVIDKLWIYSEETYGKTNESTSAST